VCLWLYIDCRLHIVWWSILASTGVVQVKHAGGSLREYMYSCDAAHAQKIAETFLSILQDYYKVDRVTLPLLKTLDQLLSSGCFRSLSEIERLCLVVSYHTFIYNYYCRFYSTACVLT